MLLSSQGGVKPFVCNSFALTRVFNFQLKQLPPLTPPQLGEEANVGVTIQARKTVEKREEANVGVTTLTPSLDGEGWDGEIYKINRNNFPLSTFNFSFKKALLERRCAC